MKKAIVLSVLLITVSVALASCSGNAKNDSIKDSGSVYYEYSSYGGTAKALENSTGQTDITGQGKVQYTSGGEKADNIVSFYPNDSKSEQKKQESADSGNDAFRSTGKYAYEQTSSLDLSAEKQTSGSVGSADNTANRVNPDTAVSISSDTTATVAATVPVVTTAPTATDSQGWITKWY